MPVPTNRRPATYTSIDLGAGEVGQCGAFSMCHWWRVLEEPDLLRRVGDYFQISPGTAVGVKIGYRLQAHLHPARPAHHQFGMPDRDAAPARCSEVPARFPATPEFDVLIDVTFALLARAATASE